MKMYQSRSSRLEVFCKKDVPRNFSKFTGKHLCQSLFFNLPEFQPYEYSAFLQRLLKNYCYLKISKLTFTCSKSIIETLEKDVKCLKLTIKIPNFFIVNFEHISCLLLVFLLLTLNE